MRLSFLAAVFCLAGVPSLARADEAQVREDEAALKDTGTDGPSLLAFLRRHTTTEADETAIHKLVREMGDDRFRHRERATGELMSMGTRAVPFLTAALKHPDIEVARRAERCLRQIEQGAAESLILSAIRLLAVRKPSGVERALLDYLGSADREHLVAVAQDALTAVAVADGKPSPVVVAALAEKNPACRSAAAVALTRAGAEAARPAVRKLLQDPQPSVRLRVGLALVTAREKDAVPAIIQSLEDLPAGEAGLAEDILYRLAGDNPPAASPGSTPEERKKFRVAWDEWFRANKEKLDLAKLADETKLRGHTLVVLLDAGRVVDIDAGKKVRWTIDGLQFPLDAQPLPGDRVLVAEYEGGQVSERNSKNEVVWSHKIAMPLAAQRLPGGHTFIASPTQMLEVDRAGKQVWSQPPPRGGRIMKATRLRNGDTAIITLLGTARFHLIDRAGKEVRSFGVEQRTSGGRIEVLNNGHVLITERDSNRVVELNTQGKIVWEARFDMPVAATRLPNGNTLVTSMNQPRAVELDRKGKEVWEYRTFSRVTRAFRY